MSRERELDKLIQEAATLRAAGDYKAALDKLLRAASLNEMARQDRLRELVNKVEGKP